MAETLPGAPRVNVKGLRERLGHNQAEFADAMHVDERTVRRWEHGYSKPSPMALAHMRTLVRRARNDAEADSSSRSEASADTHFDPPSSAHHALTSAMTTSPAPPTLPRRRIPTF